MRVIGIDPDATGGIAYVDGGVTTCRRLWFSDAHRNREVLAEVCVPGSVAYVESIPMIRGNGHVGAANRRVRYGAMLERLASLGVRVVEVAPVTWQGALRLSAGRGEGRNLHKMRMAKVARTLCPDVAFPLADAVLIAYYACQREANDVRAAQGN